MNPIPCPLEVAICGRPALGSEGPAAGFRLRVDEAPVRWVVFVRVSLSLSGCQRDSLFEFVSVLKSVSVAILAQGPHSSRFPAGFFVGEEHGGVRFSPGAASGLFAGEREREPWNIATSYRGSREPPLQPRRSSSSALIHG